MAIGETVYVNSVREQLLAGRARLADVLAESESDHVLRLLDEVDSALHRIDHGSFGVCEVCLGTVESERLLENPLAQSLPGLPDAQAAARAGVRPGTGRANPERPAAAQRSLLSRDGTLSYHYQPAGMVSGDYCDLIRENGHLYFIMADVSGKGVAAAMLSSNLRAVFHSLVPLQLSIEELMVRANRLFRESALPTQYATACPRQSLNTGELGAGQCRSPAGAAGQASPACAPSKVCASRWDSSPTIRSV